MHFITSFVRRSPQAVFWAIAWTTSLVGWAMNDLYPSILWGFMIWGPLVGGALVTAIADGRPGLKTYFGRMARWRVGLQWYAVALLLPVAIRLVAAGLTILSGASLSTGIQWPMGADLIFEVIFFVFFVSLGEEPGFRGFALPRLMAGRTALAASLILGVLHAIWHLPLFFFNGEPLINVVIVIAGAVIFTWLFNHTNGSVLLAMLLHASVDISLLFFLPLFSGADAVRQSVWLAVVFVATATLLVILNGQELGRRPEVSGETAPSEQLVMVE